MLPDGALRLIHEANEVLGDVRGLYGHPDVPEKLLDTVCSVHALAPGEDVWLVYDDTVFGGGDDGVVITRRRLCWKAFGEQPLGMRWGSLAPEDVRVDGNRVLVGAGTLPLTSWSEELARGFGGLLRELIESVSRPPTYRDAEPRHEPLRADAVIQLARRLASGSDRVHLHPEIPERKERGARAVHAQHLPEDEPILVLYDDTLWGSGRNGFVVTPYRLCWMSLLEQPGQVPWYRLDPELIRVVGKEVQVAGGRIAGCAYCHPHDVASLLVALASGTCSRTT